MYLPIAIIAFFLNGIAVSVDKFLLNKVIPEPLTYVFYISLISLLAIFALPFTQTPSIQGFILASTSTILWTLGAYFMFKALKSGLISRVIPLIGTLTPLILFLVAVWQENINISQTWAVGFLILGMLVLTANDWKGKISKKELSFELLSAVFFAFSYLILKEAYLKENVLTVLVWSRFVLIPLALVFLFVPALRRKVLGVKGQGFSLLKKGGLLFAFGQISGSLGQLLIFFAISLANPALVNSLQGTQYVFLLIIGLVIFKENYSKKVLLLKILGILFISLGLYILAFASTEDKKSKLGVTFSPKYAYELGLNPKMTYIRILDELGVKRVRLPVYWDQIETFPNTLSFTQVDFYIEQALERNVEVVLVLGYKQPRWPECFAPIWVEKLMVQEKEKKILELVRKEVEHFKKYPNIVAWQVENEPYFPYGRCQPKISRILEKEVDLVRSLDIRPVIVTDAGEPGLWFPILKEADIFGTTLYREVWDPLFGHQTYPLPPAFYRLKWQLAEALAGKKGVEPIISELQAEPWIPQAVALPQHPIEEQAKLMPVSKIEGNIRFAKEVGFSPIYLWGVEWWYFMEKNGYPEYLEWAKELFSEI